jgi:hypothetical protein
MRKIGLAAILTFHVLLVLAIALGIGSAVWTVGRLPLGDYRAIAVVASAIAFVLAFAILIYRLFLKVFPLDEGEIPEGSRQEFAYHIHVLFDLMVFSPVLASRMVPIPLLRVLYLALGARLGSNTYTSGIMCDPIFVTIGENTVLGLDSVLGPHALEGDRLGLYRIRIGNNVTVGGHAVILSGVSIGDGAIVATGAVVPKGTRIGPGEIWGGVPAKLIRARQQ